MSEKERADYPSGDRPRLSYDGEDVINALLPRALVA